MTLVLGIIVGLVAGFILGAFCTVMALHAMKEEINKVLGGTHE